MENLGEKGKDSGRGEKEKQAYKSNYLPTINKICLGIGHTSYYSIFGKLPQCSLTVPCTSLSSHLSHALPKWTKRNWVTEGREEEGAGEGPMRHHGRGQCLLAVPPSNKSTPHATGLCCMRLLSPRPSLSALLLVTFSTWINVFSPKTQACGIYSGKVLILKLGHFPLAINSEQWCKALWYDSHHLNEEEFTADSSFLLSVNSNGFGSGSGSACCTTGCVLLSFGLVY